MTEREWRPEPEWMRKRRQCICMRCGQAIDSEWCRSCGPPDAPQPDAGRCCETCKFFHEGGARNREGQCRFNAPAQVCGTGTGWSDWEWPGVFKHDYCGQWSKR